MAQSKIEWTDKVWNPVTGCTKVSQGCKNCYAETFTNRFWKARSFNEVRCHPEKLRHPFDWKKPAKIFVNSMSDLFHPDVPFDFIDDVLGTIAFCPQHIFQILTKRPERMLQYITTSEYAKGVQAINNIWLGVSVEDQATADQRIPLLLQTPAAHRFVSIEPILGPVDLIKCSGTYGDICTNYLQGTKSMPDHDFIEADNWGKLDWVICGGESGPHARPMHPDWVRSLRDQCKAASVPFFFKQWGQWAPYGLNMNTIAINRGKAIGKTNCFVHSSGASGHEAYRDSWYMFKCGKKKAGHLLNGKEHREFPEYR